MVPESSAPAHPLSKKKEMAFFLLEILAYFVLSRDGILPNSPQILQSKTSTTSSSGRRWDPQNDHVDNSFSQQLGDPASR